MCFRNVKAALLPRPPSGVGSHGLTLTRHPRHAGGLHHLNGLLSVITASVTLAKTLPRLLIQGARAAAGTRRLPESDGK